MERNYGNIGVLDIRHAEEKVFEDQFKIGNIGLVLYSKRTAHLLKHVQAGNIGGSIECEDDVQMIQGKSVLGSQALADLKAPLRMLVMGKLVVQDDLSAEALEKGLGFLQVSGKVVCPSHLLPVIQAKARSVSGKIETYPSGFKLVEKSLRFDRAQLLSLAQGSKLAVFGDVSFDKDVSPESLREKIAGLFVKGNLSVPESLLEAVQLALHPQATANISVVPEGYEVVSEDAQVGPTELALWEGAKVCFSGAVRFSPEITEGDLNKLEAFIAKEEVYCRESLLPLMVKKCDRFKTRFVPYKARLFFNEGQAELSRGYLTQGEGGVTVVNLGMLTLDPSITADEIRAKVDLVRNSGVLMVSDAQMGAVQEKAKGSEGPIMSGSGAGSDAGGTGNVGFLKL